jgi:ribose 5-phosphate isomerase A
MSSDIAKRAAGRAAAELVTDGMVLGLGTGSTANAFIQALGERVARGLKVTAAPTSVATETLARQCGIALQPFTDVDRFDLCIDGADEIGPDFSLIKGGGAALLREKIIANAAREMIVIADEGKLVTVLGAFPLPVEVTSFAHELTARALLRTLLAVGIDAKVLQRRSASGEGPLVTDGGNYIYDAFCGAIPDPAGLAERLNAVPGIVEHGLFIGVAGRVILGASDGTTRMLNEPGLEV